jgi:CD109 antigen
VEQNKPVMVDLSSQASFKESVTPSFPRDTVEGSEFAEVSVVGDIMGPILENIEHLVRMPYGCGEQNMVNFVPNIVVMRYLKATDRLTTEIEGKAKKFMEAGYQRELTYKRQDHSFSAFGDGDDTGSTFLTAFVVKSFKQAKKYIFVDDKVLEDSIGFLLEKQTPDGDFQEDGEVHHKGLLGGNSKGGKMAMTAYIVSALQLNGRKNSAGIKYLEKNLNKANTPYARALTAYALQLVDSPKKDEAFNLHSRDKVEKGGLVHWEAERKKRDDDTPDYWWEPPPADVEITSYALLNMVLRDQVVQALPIVRWLASKRNSLGGYSSTQGTVMALQALGAYAEKAYSPSFNVQLKFKSGNQQEQFHVVPDNALSLQSVKLSSPRNEVEITASGSGLVYAQLSWRYNLPKQTKNQAFDCEAVTDEKNSNAISVNLCCRYKKGAKSNMAVIGVDTLSGFQFEEEDVQSLTTLPDLQRVELGKGNTHADLYFQSIGSDRKCVELKSERAFKVAEQKPAVYQAYDYYKPSDRVDFTYSPNRLPSFAASCPECWENMVKGVTPSGGGGNCKNRFNNCKVFCFPSRTDRPYREWFTTNQKWLRKNCRKSCELC